MMADPTSDFAYFESVHQLAIWRTTSASTLHISNTPLLPRPQASRPIPPAAAPTGTQEQSTIPKIRRVLICHDFKGGYLPYEVAQGIESSTTVYTCEYLQYVDTFVYFSHKLVAIPPVSWINLMHKNGVKILGTFIVEGGSGSSKLGEIFKPGPDSPDAAFYANQLVLLAKTYGFDGWLLNFESTFPTDIFDLPIFHSWLDYLKDEMHRVIPGSQVIWYDFHKQGMESSAN